jgi:hypothetical protein
VVVVVEVRRMVARVAVKSDLVCMLSLLGWIVVGVAGNTGTLSG